MKGSGVRGCPIVTQRQEAEGQHGKGRTRGWEVLVSHSLEEGEGQSGQLEKFRKHPFGDKLPKRTLGYQVLQWGPKEFPRLPGYRIGNTNKPFPASETTFHWPSQTLEAGKS